MEKAKCEFNSLLVGMILNFIFMILGIVFYARTHSSSMLLDATVSAVLSITTLVSIIVSHNVNKRATSKYPLGRYAIENMFLLFRSMSMIAVVIFSIIEGSVTIFDFYVNKGDVAYDATNTELVIYGILTAILGFGITITYFVNYLRSKKTSEILKLELKGSIYDIMVNTFAIISLLLFANVSFLKELAPIADAIVVIILSIVYACAPSVELVNQVKVLIDKRRFVDEENKLFDYLSDKYKECTFNDIYYNNSGNIINIYVTFTFNENKLYEEIKSVKDAINDYLYNKYPGSKVYLLIDERKIHKL